MVTVQLVSFLSMFTRGWAWCPNSTSQKIGEESPKMVMWNPSPKGGTLSNPWNWRMSWSWSLDVAWMGLKGGFFFRRKVMLLKIAEVSSWQLRYLCRKAPIWPGWFNDWHRYHFVVGELIDVSIDYQWSTNVRIYHWLSSVTIISWCSNISW